MQEAKATIEKLMAGINEKTEGCPLAFIVSVVVCACVCRWLCAAAIAQKKHPGTQSPCSRPNARP